MTYPTLTISRGSTSLELSEANGITVMPGVEGFDTPPVALSENEPADFDGSVVTNVRYTPREVFVPVFLQANSTNQVRSQTRALASLLNPQLGPVTLTVRQDELTGELLSADVVDGVAAAFDTLPVSPGTASVVTSVTSPKRSGTYSLKVEPGAFATFSQIGLASGEQPTVSTSQVFEVSASVWVRCDTTPARCAMRLHFLDASGALLAQQWTPYQDSTTSFAQLELTTQAPPGTAKINMLLVVLASPSAPDAHYFDDFSIRLVDTSRSIEGYLSAPLGDSLTTTESDSWRKLGLSLRCPDPMWSGELATTYASGSTLRAYNPGDALSWPTWFVEMDSGYPLTLTNSSDPQLPSLVISDSVTTNEVSIVTDPRNLAVVETGSPTTRWPIVSDGSFLFPFVPGDNVITGTNIGSSSTVYATYTPRWLTAW